MADVNLSFAGCGFLGIYHVGVVSCIKKYAPFLVQNKVIGTSAGGLAGTVLLLNCCLGQSTSFILRMAAKARSRALGPLHPDFDVVRPLRRGLEEILPPDAHLRCTGRLFLSVTRVSDGENVLLSNYPTREHLIQAILCTTFIPLFSGLQPPTFDGVAYVDGGFSNNLPTFPSETTITISPFAGESDICPRDFISSQSLHSSVRINGTSLLLSERNIYRLSRILFPPHPAELATVCQNGFRDTLKFLARSGYIARVPEIVELHACVELPKSESTASSHSIAQHFERYKYFHSVSHQTNNSTVTTGDSLPIGPICNDINFLPPMGRQEFAELVADSQRLLYHLFQSKPYRVCSVLASPLYLPSEYCFRVFSKVSRFSWSCAQSLYKSAVDKCGQVVDGFYGKASLYSPVLIKSRPDGRLTLCLNNFSDEKGEDLGKEGAKNSTSNRSLHYSASRSRRSSGRNIYVRLNSLAEEPENELDSETANACLENLLDRSSTLTDVKSLPEFIGASSPKSDGMGKNGSVANGDHVGGRGKSGMAAPVLSYYFPDRETDQVLLWEVKEIDNIDN